MGVVGDIDEENFKNLISQGLCREAVRLGYSN